jgi:hypothetical protein
MNLTADSMSGAGASATSGRGRPGRMGSHTVKRLPSPSLPRASTRARSSRSPTRRLISSTWPRASRTHSARSSASDRRSMSSRLVRGVSSGFRQCSRISHVSGLPQAVDWVEARHWPSSAPRRMEARRGAHDTGHPPVSASVQRRRATRAAVPARRRTVTVDASRAREEAPAQWPGPRWFPRGRVSASATWAPPRRYWLCSSGWRSRSAR